MRARFGVSPTAPPPTSETSPCRVPGWGQSEALRAQGQELKRWHWAYGGTCFRLHQRAQTQGGRPVILSRGYVMTRDGVDGLTGQLWAEVMRHGLGRANQVLIVADGAVWIWNLAGDRFPGERAQTVRKEVILKGSR